MRTHTLRLLEDRLDPGARCDPPLPPANRVIYVFSGTAKITGEKGSITCIPNQAWYGSESVTVEAGPEGAVLLRWELVPAAMDDDALARGSGVVSAFRLGPTIELDPKGRYLMRCDRVDFPLGGVALLHTHQGPGIRCLVQGHFSVTTEGRTMEFEPLGAWFEPGPEPVYAVASLTEPSAFVRVMILPDRLKGQSSIRYVNAVDRDKPKSQRYTVFLDEPINI